MAGTSYAQKKSETFPGKTAAAEKAEPTSKIPPAGPHADPKLTNETATPGSGALPTVGDHAQKDVDGGVG